MGRGLERRYIFENDDDKSEFLDQLGRSLEKGDAVCLAWAVMSNHYHLLIRVGVDPLSRLMASLLTGYAVNYNRRHDRSGYLYQNRFKSVLCDEDEYLLKLISYIHLNPWKAGMLRRLVELDGYPWTGHAGLLGQHVQEWQAIDEVLNYFSSDPNKARRTYRQFVWDQSQDNLSVNLSGGGLIRSYNGWHPAQRKKRDHEVRVGDERILGKSAFVEAMLQDDLLGLDKSTEYASRGWNLASLIQVICLRYEVEKSQLAMKGRMSNLSKARKIIAYFAISELGIASFEVEQILDVTQSGVSRLRSKGCQQSVVEGITLAGLEAMLLSH